ncbi:MAG: non-canonical purine NTP pyrophosphatase [Lachnospiraceae bacterium]|nr:non-canonical purine NTP pyrophosphatase [Lachnospiraceae bacterium]
MKVVLATGNKNKLREIREIAGGKMEIIPSSELGITEEPEENGGSFRENALIKARFVKSKTDLPVMADDSGLIVDAMGGLPGVESARFLGEDTPYSVKNAEVIKRLSDVNGIYRSARFVCCAVFIGQDGSVLSRTGVINGCIGYGVAGENGFGYDPAFFIDPFDAMTACRAAGMPDSEAVEMVSALGRENMASGVINEDLKGYISTAQLPPDVKDAVSHRGRAFRFLFEDIRSI